MGKRGRGFGRRMVLNLDGDSQHTSNGQAFYQGLQNSSNIPAATQKSSAASQPPSGVPSGLVGYGDSDDDSSDSEGAPTPPRADDDGDFQLEKEADGAEKTTETAVSPAEEGITEDTSTAAAAPVEVTQASKPEAEDPAPVNGKGGPPLIHNNSMDTKLADFLAEIESISTDVPEESSPAPKPSTDAAADPQGVPTNTETPATPPPEETSSESEEELPPLVKPTAPATVWQHCLDESTQCYYYWHVVKNTVTWELPEEYSQYLLQVKEYEAKLAKYEAEVKLREARPKEKKKRPKKPPPVEPTKPASKSATATVLPDLEPPEVPDGERELVPQMPPTGGSRSDYTKFINFVASKTTDSLPQIEESLPDTSTPARPPKPTLSDGDALPSPIGPQLPTDVTSQAPTDNDSSPMIGPQLPEPSQPAALIGPQLPDGQTADPVVGKTENGPGSPSGAKRRRHSSSSSDASRSRHKKHKHKKRKSRKHSSDSSSRSRSRSRSGSRSRSRSASSDSQVKQKPSPARKSGDKERRVAESDDLALDDLDDIDKQLELALEKKKEELKELENVDTQHPKRKRHVAHDTNAKKPKKKPRKGKAGSDSDHDGRPNKHKESKRKLDRADVKRKAEIADLSTLVTDKLEFLEVSRKGLSKLQILLVEIETRLNDWRAGSLETHYMLEQLRDAHNQLQLFEAGAAPPGWACNWDRTYRRYFYFNETTGQTRWEYPEDPPEGSLVPRPPSYPPPGQEAAYNLRKEGVGWPPPVAEVPPPKPSKAQKKTKHKTSRSSPTPAGRVDVPLGERMAVVDPSATHMPVQHPGMEYHGLPLGAPPPPPPPEEHAPHIEMMPEMLHAPPPPPPAEIMVNYDMGDIDGIAMEPDGGPDHVIRAGPVIVKSVPSGTSSPDTLVAQDGTTKPETTVPVESSAASTSTGVHKERRKKKDKKISGGLALKKKNFPSLVEKWQQIQHQVEKESQKQKRQLMDD